MRVRLAIGDFSRMTHLSVVTLRHYHEVGLLTPAEIDPQSGYRFYEPGQVRIAQVILLAAALQALMAVVEWPTGWNLWHDTSWQGAGDARSIEAANQLAGLLEWRGMTEVRARPGS